MEEKHEIAKILARKINSHQDRMKLPHFFIIFVSSCLHSSTSLASSSSLKVAYMFVLFSSSPLPWFVYSALGVVLVAEGVQAAREREKR
jgi:predicted branched-subunit amino acid permease